MTRGPLPIRLAATLAALLLLAPAGAAADVVQMPPSSCPDGSIARTGHVGPHCAPVSCTADADCPDGLQCRPAALCQEQVHGASRGGPITVWSVTAPCGEGDFCVGGATCKKQSYCMEPETPTPAPTTTPPASTEASDEPEGKPGCSAAGGGVGLLGLLVAVSLACALPRRRRSG